MLHMVFKLGQCAEQNWRKLRGFDYLAKVISGVTFKDGIETTEKGQIASVRASLPYPKRLGPICEEAAPPRRTFSDGHSIWCHREDLSGT